MPERQPLVFDRRAFHRFVIGGLGVALAAPSTQTMSAAEPLRHPQSCREAVERLLGGNNRFVSSELLHPHISEQWRERLTAGQQPFATILGCSDSRVPPEILFDQGFGDLFVIRVAGNIVAPSQVGSVEFAAQQFQTRLVVVLGHSGCGAIDATLAELERPSADRSPHLGSIVDRIRPALQTLIEAAGSMDREALLKAGVRANIRASVDHLRHGSRILEQRIQAGELLVVGAKYSLESGEVAFFEDE